MRRLPYLSLPLLVILLLFPSCHKETEEEKIRKVIAAVQKSAEEKKDHVGPGACLEDLPGPAGEQL
jgi:hypothetical protein